MTIILRRDPRRWAFHSRSQFLLSMKQSKEMRNGPRWSIRLKLHWVQLIWHIIWTTGMERLEIINSKKQGEKGGRDPRHKPIPRPCWSWYYWFCSKKNSQSPGEKWLWKLMRSYQRGRKAQDQPCLLLPGDSLLVHFPFRIFDKNVE